MGPVEGASSSDGQGVDFWSWLRRLFTREPSVASQVADTQATALGGSTIPAGQGGGYVSGQVANTAAGIGGASAPAAGGGASGTAASTSGFTWADAASGGSALIDAYQRNRNAARDREVSMQELQMHETQGAEENLQARERLRLDQQVAERDAEERDYRSALIGAIGRNTQDVSFDRTGFQSNVPTLSFSGGLRPSVVGEQGRANATLMETAASRRLANPEARTTLPPMERIRFWDPAAERAAQSRGGHR
jgi:hypothetical protein